MDHFEGDTGYTKLVVDLSNNTSYLTDLYESSTASFISDAQESTTENTWSDGDHLVLLRSLYWPQGSKYYNADVVTVGKISYTAEAVEQLKIGSFLTVNGGNEKIYSITKKTDGYCINDVYYLRYNASENVYDIECPAGGVYGTLDGAGTLQLDENAVVDLANIGGNSNMTIDDYFLNYYFMYDSPVFKITTKNNVIVSAEFVQEYR